jgi:hypothetical protein
MKTHGATEPKSQDNADNFLMIRIGTVAVQIFALTTSFLVDGANDAEIRWNEMSTFASRVDRSALVWSDSYSVPDVDSTILDGLSLLRDQRACRRPKPPSLLVTHEFFRTRAITTAMRRIHERLLVLGARSWSQRFHGWLEL